MCDLIEFLVREGLLLGTGATILLTLGCGCVRLMRAPIGRQRTGELALAVTMLWLAFASLPLPRLLSDRMLSRLRPESWHWLSRGVENRIADAERETSVIAGLQSRPSSASPEFADSGEATGGIPHGTDSSFDWRHSAAARLATRLCLTNFPEHAAGAFVLGAAIVGAFLFGAQAWLLKMRVTAEEPPQWLVSLYESIPSSLRYPQLQLLIGRQYGRPMTWGVLRPVIFLPAGLCRRENCRQLRMVLLHEAAHVVRRDAWGKLLFAVALPVLYWNPFYWRLRREVEFAAELLADDSASQQADKTRYVAELVALAKGSRGKTIALIGASGMFSGSSQFYRRMQMLLERDQPLKTQSSAAWKATSLATCGAVVALSTLLAGVRPSSAEEGPRAPAVPRQSAAAPSRGAEKAGIWAQMAELQARLRAIEAEEAATARTSTTAVDSSKESAAAVITLTWANQEGIDFCERWSVERPGMPLKLVEVIQSRHARRVGGGGDRRPDEIPTPEQILSALPGISPQEGSPFRAESTRKNIRIAVETIVDSIGEPRFYPMVGVARLKKVHFKCTVFYDKEIRSDWPIPFRHSDPQSEVVFIDHDHLIRAE